MYPKTNDNARQKNADKNAKDVSKKEIAAENGNDPIFQPVGNEGMNDLLSGPFDLRDPDGENGDDILNEDGAGAGDGLNVLGNAAGGAGGNQPVPEKKIEDAKKQEEKINEEDDPEKVLDIIPNDVADQLVDKVVKANPRLAPDLIVEPPRRRKKAAKKPANIEQAKDDMKPADLEQAEDDMKPAEGFDFKPVKIPSRKKAGSRDRFLSGLAFYT